MVGTNDKIIYENHMNNGADSFYAPINCNSLILLEGSNFLKARVETHQWIRVEAEWMKKDSLANNA
jgi:hypothetical protein